MKPTPVRGGGAFAQHRGVHVLAGLRVVPGPLPLARRPRTGRRGRHARDAWRSARAGSKRSPRSRPARAANATGVYGGAERGGAEFRDRVHAEQRRAMTPDGDHPGGLALVVRGADGGVALDVFHRAHARPRWRGARRPRWSRWKSTKWLVAAGRVAGTCRAPARAAGRGEPDRRPRRRGRSAAPKPAAVSAAAPAPPRRPPRRQPARSKLPPAEPATLTGRAARAGQERARAPRRSAACRRPG